QSNITLVGIKGNEELTKEWTEDHPVHVWTWDVPTGKELNSWVSKLASYSVLTPDFKFLACFHVRLFDNEGKCSELRILEMRSGKEIFSREEDFLPIAAALSPDGQRLALVALFFSKDRSDLKLVVRDLVTGRNICTLPALTMDPSKYPSTPRLWFADQGERLIFAWDTNFTVWDLPSGGKRLSLEGDCDHFRIMGMLTSPDGKYLAGERKNPGKEDHDVIVWDLQTGKQVPVRAEKGLPVNSLIFSPDSQRLAIAWENAKKELTIEVRHVASGKEVFTLENAASVNQLLFSPNGKWLVGRG